MEGCIEGFDVGCIEGCVEGCVEGCIEGCFDAISAILGVALEKHLVKAEKLPIAMLLMLIGALKFFTNDFPIIARNISS